MIAALASTSTNCVNPEPSSPSLKLLPFYEQLQCFVFVSGIDFQLRKIEDMPDVMLDCLHCLILCALQSRLKPLPSFDERLADLNVVVILVPADVNGVPKRTDVNPYSSMFERPARVVLCSRQFERRA